MIYTQRRIARHRQMRRTVIKYRIQNAVTSIKAFIPDLIATAGIVFGIFYLLPILFAVIAATVK